MSDSLNNKNSSLVSRVNDTNLEKSKTKDNGNNEETNNAKGSMFIMSKKYKKNLLN